LPMGRHGNRPLHNIVRNDLPRSPEWTARQRFPTQHRAERPVVVPYDKRWLTSEGGPATVSRWDGMETDRYPTSCGTTCHGRPPGRHGKRSLVRGGRSTPHWTRTPTV